MAHVPTAHPWLAQVAEPLTREGAREAAQRELLKREYHVAEPSLLDRIVNRVLESLGELLGETVDVVPGGLGGLVLLLVLLTLLVVATRLGLGPLAARDRLADRRRSARSMTAADYRAEADRLAAAGEWKDAVRARFRAIVRELEQRGVLDARPGRTAGEIAREAADAVPAVSAPAHDAAGVFDAVWYGRRAATAADHDLLKRSDDAVRDARLAVASVP